MPKRFFGAARNIEGGGSLTILATALVDTGSKMDERRIFPAVDIIKSGTRREDKLLSSAEMECNYTLRRMAATMTAVEMTQGFYDLMHKTKTNAEFVERLPVWEKQLGRGDA